MIVVVVVISLFVRSRVLARASCLLQETTRGGRCYFAIREKRVGERQIFSPKRSTKKIWDDDTSYCRAISITMLRERLPHSYRDLKVRTRVEKKRILPRLIGQVVKVRFDRVWRSARIVKQGRDRDNLFRVLVHYCDEKSDLLDEWIDPKDKSRVRFRKEDTAYVTRQAAVPRRASLKKRRSVSSNQEEEEKGDMEEERKRLVYHRREAKKNLNWRIRRWLEDKAEEGVVKATWKRNAHGGPETTAATQTAPRRPLEPSRVFRTAPIGISTFAISTLPSPPRRPSFAKTFDRSLLRNIRISERAMRGMSRKHRYA